MRLKTTILLTALLGTMASTILLAGCGNTAESNSADIASVPSQDVSGMDPAPSAAYVRQDISRLSRYEEIPFSLEAQSKGKTPEALFFCTLPEYWNDAVYDTIHYRQALEQYYAAGSHSIPSLEDGTVLRFSFGGYTPDEVRVIQDTDPTDGVSSNASNGSNLSEVEVMVASDGSYSFIAKTPEASSGTVYYEIVCTWKTDGKSTKDVVHYATVVSLTSPQGIKNTSAGDTAAQDPGNSQS